MSATRTNSTDMSSPVTRTVVLSGVGPRISLTSPVNSQVTIVTGTKVKTINLGSSANVEFAA